MGLDLEVQARKIKLHIYMPKTEGKYCYLMMKTYGALVETKSLTFYQLAMRWPYHIVLHFND